MNLAPYFKRKHLILRDVNSNKVTDPQTQKRGGYWGDDGEWVSAELEVIEIFANVQPAFSMNQTRLLPEGDRDKQAVWGSSNDWVYSSDSGSTMFEPDVLFYMDGFWEVKGTMPYENRSALQHVEFVAIKIRDERISRYQGIVDALRS